MICSRKKIVQCLRQFGHCLDQEDGDAPFDTAQTRLYDRSVSLEGDEQAKQSLCQRSGWQKRLGLTMLRGDLPFNSISSRTRLLTSIIGANHHR